MKINTLRNPLFILALASGLGLATGCGDDDNAEPTTVDVTSDEDAGTDDEDASDTTNESDTESDTRSSSTSSSTTSGTDGGNTTGEEQDAGDTNGADEDAGDTTDEDEDGGETSEDAGADSGPVVEECVENEEACFSCPETPEQFLTQCTTAQCAPFNNAVRLGRYIEGQPLPTP